MTQVPLTALVTGATGTIGPALVNALLQIGIPVRTLSRGCCAPGLFAGPTESAIGDISNRHAVEQAVSGVATVFHLAAKLHHPNPTPEMAAEFERVNVEGTRVIVEAARAAGVARLVIFSTVSVYGSTGPEPVDESAATRPETVYSETKLRAEQLALSAPFGASRGFEVVVLRMAAVYGPRMKGNYHTLVNALARGRFLPVGNGANIRTLVYVGDAARAAILAATHPYAAGRTYNVSDGELHTFREILGAICGSLGRRPPRLFVPAAPARLAATALDRLMAASGRTPWLKSAVDKSMESVAVRADKIQRELGFRPEYDLHRGWKQTVETRPIRYPL